MCMSVNQTIGIHAVFSILKAYIESICRCDLTIVINFVTLKEFCLGKVIHKKNCNITIKHSKRFRNTKTFPISKGRIESEDIGELQIGLGQYKC